MRHNSAHITGSTPPSMCGADIFATAVVQAIWGGTYAVTTELQPAAPPSP
jgi:hypothetical protein